MHLIKSFVSLNPASCTLKRSQLEAESQEQVPLLQRAYTLQKPDLSSAFNVGRIAASPSLRAFGA